MKPFEIDDTQQTTLATIEAEIIEAIDDHNAAVAAGNNELAQMIQLSLRGLKLRRERLLKAKAREGERVY